MDKISQKTLIRPGTKALTLVDDVIHGIGPTDPSRKFTCTISRFQLVEIDSEPGWIYDETGRLVEIIAINVPDHNGVIQSIGIELKLLLIAANDN